MLSAIIMLGVNLLGRDLWFSLYLLLVRGGTLVLISTTRLPRSAAFAITPPPSPSFSVCRVVSCGAPRLMLDIHRRGGGIPLLQGWGRQDIAGLGRCVRR